MFLQASGVEGLAGFRVQGLRFRVYSVQVPGSFMLPPPPPPPAMSGKTHVYSVGFRVEGLGV